MRSYILLSLLLFSTGVFSQTPAWTRVNPLPFGESIIDIQKIPGTNRIIAAHSQSTVLISDNAGETWQTIMYPGNMPYDFRPKGLFFLNDHVGFLYGSEASILKTNDAGLTWHVCNTPSYPTTHEFNISDMDFSNESVGFAIVNSTLLKTTDQGETWSEVSFWYFPDSYDLNCIEFVNEQVGYIPAEGWFTLFWGVIKTNDGGDTWNLDPDFSYFDNMQFISPLIGFGSTSYYIYKTIDGGLSWKEVFFDSNNRPAFRFEFSNSLNGIAFSTSGYFTSSFFLTSDGGETWQPVNGSDENICCNDLVYYDDNIIFSLGNYGCMFKSSNGGHYWEKISHNSFTGEIRDVKVFDENNGIILSAQHADHPVYMLKTHDGFSSYDTILTISNSFTEFDFPSRDTGFCGTYLSHDSLFLCYRTTNGGQTWSYDTISGIQHPINNIDFYNGTNGLINFYGSRLFLTSDCGESWQEIMFPEDVTLNSASYISDSKIIISAKDAAGPFLYTSEDKGETWSIIMDDQPAAGKIYFTDEMKGFLLTDNPEIYRTTDGGITWNKCLINANPFHSFYDITFPSADTGYIVGRADYENVLKSTDGGLTWNSVHAPDILAYYKVEFPTNESGYIFGGWSIFKTTSGGILGITSQPQVTKGFQVYPNPFQSGMRIDVTEMNLQSAYQMDVFSLNGTQVYSTSIQPQTTSIWFQGSMLSPGIYFLQFKIGNKVIETIKVIKI